MKYFHRSQNKKKSKWKIQTFHPFSLGLQLNVNSANEIANIRMSWRTKIGKNIHNYMHYTVNGLQGVLTNVCQVYMITTHIRFVFFFLSFYNAVNGSLSATVYYIYCWVYKHSHTHTQYLGQRLLLKWYKTTTATYTTYLILMRKQTSCKKSSITTAVIQQKICLNAFYQAELAIIIRISVFMHKRKSMNYITSECFVCTISDTKVPHMDTNGKTHIIARVRGILGVKFRYRCLYNELYKYDSTFLDECD